MAVIGGFAFLVLLVAAITGPIAILVFGHRRLKWVLIAIFIAGIVGIPLAAVSEPSDFRGTALIMSVAIFAFGLTASNVAGAFRAPRRVQ